MTEQNEAPRPSPSIWILLAMAYAAEPGSPVGLEHLIAAADYLNHGLPTYEKAAGAIRYFMAQGWVTVDAEGPRLAGAAAQAVEKIVRPGRSSRKEYEDLEEFLLTHPARESEFPDPGFTAADWQAACDSYLRQHRVTP